MDSSACELPRLWSEGIVSQAREIVWMTGSWRLNLSEDRQCSLAFCVVEKVPAIKCAFVRNASASLVSV